MLLSEHLLNMVSRMGSEPEPELAEGRSRSQNI